MKSIYTKSILFLLFLTLIMSNDMKSQDIHFSHIHASPTFLNPAYTGVHNGTIRVIMNYPNLTILRKIRLFLKMKYRYKGDVSFNLFYNMWPRSKTIM